MNFIIPALGLGLLGSFHCVGMCGPIVISLPFINKGKFDFLIPTIFYNSGRILTYMFLGILFGSFGQLFEMAGLQQILSITAGAIILLYAFTSLKKLSGIIQNINFLNTVQLYISRLINKKGNLVMLGIGLLNGLLPCGLIYIALAGAMATGSLISGAVFMALFGLGTLPIMIFIPILKYKMSFSFKTQIRKLYPVIFALTGLLMIVRGMGLGIPYVSPEFNKKTNVIESCCKEDSKACCKK